MLTWFRVRASRVAAALLLAVVAFGGSLAAPHATDCHDVTCASAVVAHDASAHRVRGATAAAAVHPLHCLVCHWARSFRPPTEARVLSAPAGCAGACLRVDVFTAYSAAPAAQPPLRSPPAPQA